MATIQSTDLRIKVEPTIVTPELDFGPLDSVSANSVLLTRENLRKVGAYPPRNGQDWDCHLWVYTTIDGVETALDLADMAFTAVYWDYFARVANALTIAAGAGTGQLTISFAADDEPTAGMYRFAVTGKETVLLVTNVFDVCGGWLEILPAIPS